MKTGDEVTLETKLYERPLTLLFALGGSGFCVGSFLISKFIDAVHYSYPGSKTVSEMKDAFDNSRTITFDRTRYMYQSALLPNGSKIIYPE